MCTALTQHPLCTAFAAALKAERATEVRIHSLCLAHLDDQALLAAASALKHKGCLVGLTVNDSVTIHRHSPLESGQVITLATEAAATRLGYPLKFDHLPNLRKANEPPPTLALIAKELRGGVPTNELPPDPDPNPAPGRRPSPNPDPDMPPRPPPVHLPCSPSTPPILNNPDPPRAGAPPPPPPGPPLGGEVQWGPSGGPPTRVAPAAVDFPCPPENWSRGPRAPMTQQQPGEPEMVPGWCQGTTEW